MVCIDVVCIDAIIEVNTLSVCCLFCVVSIAFLDFVTWEGRFLELYYGRQCGSEDCVGKRNRSQCGGEDFLGCFEHIIFEFCFRVSRIVDSHHSLSRSVISIISSLHYLISPLSHLSILHSHSPPTAPNKISRNIS